MNDNLGIAALEITPLVFAPVSGSTLPTAQGFAEVGRPTIPPPASYERTIDAQWWLIAIAIGAALWAILLSLV